MGRNKSVILGFLKERVRKRLQSWDGRFLSRAGKEILIKTVAQALPSYAMSVFLLPLEISRDIEKQMSQFWWKSKATQGRGIHWMNWDRLSKHKCSGGMGFRDLRDFNIALLGKQGWRLMMQPASLVSKVFKARYYPRSTFLDASIGDNPSFVWRSIWESKQVLEAGIQWRVGDGSTIPILNTRWLPDEVEPIVSTNHPALVGQKVCSLINPETGQWDSDLLCDIFEERDINLILNIPLDSTNHDDCMYWSKEISGVYSVRSAYRLLQFLKGRWGSELDSGFWKRVWSLKIPPKIKDFVWRACVGILPTMHGLRSKQHVQRECPICAQTEETTTHILVCCNFATQCLYAINIGGTVDPAVSFATWFGDVGARVGKVKQGEVAAVCWSIWKARNELVWNRRIPRVEEVVSTAKLYLEQWKVAQDRSKLVLSSSSVEEDGAVAWVRPNELSIKVNVDAAIFTDRGQFGLGMVARDSSGQLVEARTFCRAGVVVPELAEVIGIKEALSWIKGKRWENAILESDCLVAINAIRSNIFMRSPFGLVVEECRQILHNMNNVSCLFIYRSANKVAHSFARASCSFPDRCFNRGNVPVDLLSTLLDDCSSI